MKAKESSQDVLNLQTERAQLNARLKEIRNLLNIDRARANDLKRQDIEAAFGGQVRITQGQFEHIRWTINRSVADMLQS